ncbi:GNAT family N-acetyltransferase [Naasia aerilata]|uniref:N-acetyltransferase domain-containing protein n=1 Tax=Naasia aerilata TaxID=1162966 RepID=A0ABM8GER2_9MICO|nr:GNAT family N-acetyltransferase [Naasia aerilata]BDZ46798.1 hypothetical protein GCM10025866_27070 [Naasia aerilata]
MTTAEITIRPIHDVPQEDVDAVFGTRGDPAGCWCQFFKLTNAQWDARTRDDRRDLLCEQARVAPGPGLVAYRDGEPAGWVAVEPRVVYPRLRRARVTAELRPEFDDPTVWAITCFVVPVGHRNQGVAGALASAAVEHARAHGAASVEGYPVDTDENPRLSAADRYHGTVRLFERAGLTVVSRPAPARAIMRLTF